MNSQFEPRSTNATYLHIAASCFNFSAIEALLEHGLQSAPDCRGQTPLHWLLIANEEYFRYEVEDMDDENLGQRKVGATALSAAVHAATVFLELTQADVNDQDNLGRTGVQYAAKLKSVEMMKLLLSFGASFGVKDAQGSTALHAFAQPVPHGEPWCT